MNWHNLGALLFVFLCATDRAWSGYVTIPGTIGGGAVVKVKSIKERHFERTVKQQYDFSCGSAVLATLLTYHYENPVSEQQVFDEMYGLGDKEKINRFGFSLLDIKNYLERHKYKADGFRLSLDEIRKLSVPGIALITHNGFKHFVVLKGVSDADVLIGDPTYGVKRMRRNDFERMWNKIIFVVRSKKDVGTRHFNDHEDWTLVGKAPNAVDVASGMSLDVLTLHQAEHLGF